MTLRRRRRSNRKSQMTAPDCVRPASGGAPPLAARDSDQIALSTEASRHRSLSNLPLQGVSQSPARSLNEAVDIAVDKGRSRLGQDSEYAREKTGECCREAVRGFREAETPGMLCDVGHDPSPRWPAH